VILLFIGMNFGSAKGGASCFINGTMQAIDKIKLCLLELFEAKAGGR